VILGHAQSRASSYSYTSGLMAFDGAPFAGATQLAKADTVNECNRRVRKLSAILDVLDE